MKVKNIRFLPFWAGGGPLSELILFFRYAAHQIFVTNNLLIVSQVIAWVEPPAQTCQGM